LWTIDTESNHQGSFFKTQILKGRRVLDAWVGFNGSSTLAVLDDDGIGSTRDPYFIDLDLDQTTGQSSYSEEEEYDTETDESFKPQVDHDKQYLHEIAEVSKESSKEFLIGKPPSLLYNSKETLGDISERVKALDIKYYDSEERVRLVSEHHITPLPSSQQSIANTERKDSTDREVYDQDTIESLLEKIRSQEQQIRSLQISNLRLKQEKDELPRLIKENKSLKHENKGLREQLKCKEIPKPIQSCLAKGVKNQNGRHFGQEIDRNIEEISLKRELLEKRMNLFEERMKSKKCSRR